MNTNVKTILETLLSSQEYFKEIKYSDDIGQFATMIDDFNELPSIGVFFNDYTPYDWQGSPLVSCDLTFFIACDMLSPTEEAETMQEFLTNVNGFISLLSPYVQTRPKELRHFKDTVLRGVLISVNFLQNYSCGDAPTPPVPPDPEPPTPTGDYYDMLTAVNGTGGSNVFVLPVYDFNISAKTKIIVDVANFGGQTTTAQSGLIVFEIKATSFGGAPTNFNILLLNNNNTVTYDFENDNWTAKDADSNVITRSFSINYGTSHRCGLIRLFGRKTTNGTATQSISGVQIWQYNKLQYDLKPFRTTGGTVGLKDTITGELFAPQYNDTITVENENENSRSLTLGSVENLEKSVISTDEDTEMLKIDNNLKNGKDEESEETQSEGAEDL